MLTEEDEMTPKRIRVKIIDALTMDEMTALEEKLESMKQFDFEISIHMGDWIE